MLTRVVTAVTTKCEAWIVDAGLNYHHRCFVFHLIITFYALAHLGCSTHTPHYSPTKLCVGVAASSKA